MQVCAGTKIGNNMIRGVSGGQRKRVTTGPSLQQPHTMHEADACSAQTVSHWKRLA